MKKTLLCVALFVMLEQSTARSQYCTSCAGGTRGLAYSLALSSVQNTYVNSSKPAYERYDHSIKVKRDTGYYDVEYEVFDHGKVFITPPLGKAPSNFPQPGSPGGGARPEDNPYIAAMAPNDTVPVAIFPPFDTNPEYPTKCVIFSELTDFEEAEIIDYDNIQVTYETLYSPHISEINETRQKRNMDSNRLFGPRNSRNAQTTSSLSFGPLSYAPPTEPTARVIRRKFGFVCEVTVDTCVLPDNEQFRQFQPNLQYGQPQQYGQYGQTQQFGQYGQPQQYGQTIQNDQSQQTHLNGLKECNLNGDNTVSGIPSAKAGTHTLGVCNSAQCR